MTIITDKIQDLSASNILVATPRLQDELFGKTVILLVEHGEHGTIGTILNRTTGDVLPPFPCDEANNKDVVLYDGGPVEAFAPLMSLVRSREVAPDRPFQICDGVSYGGAMGAIFEITFNAVKPRDVMISTGMVGWGKGQLANEIKGGFWHVLPFDCKIAFTEDKANLWEACIRKIEAKPAPVACAKCTL